MGYSPEQKELLDAIQIMIDNTLNSQVTKIYSCIMYDIGNNKQCAILLNGQTHAVQYYGDEPTVGQQYKVFVPFNNMAQAFVITGGSAGSDPSTTNDYSQLTNKPSINSVTLSGNSTSTDLGLYGSGNEPNYPVTKVNNKTGEVSLTATDLNAVPTSRTINGKALSTNISLTSSDVGALPSSTVIPTQTSQLTNNSGFITSVQAPVQSVNGQTGTVSLSIPTKTSDLTNDNGFITSAQSPVQSVNTKTGAVVLTQDDVGDGATYVRTENNFTDANVTKLDGIATGANNYALPVATTSVLGGVKSGTDIAVDASGNVTVSKLNAQLPAYYLNRANHTGTQLASTISDFVATVRATILTGLSTATNAIVTATDTVLTAIGKLQAQITAHINNKSNPHEVTATQIGAVPITRTVNGKVLSANIALTSADVGALPDTTSIPTKTSDLTNDSKFLPVTQTSPTNGQIVVFDGVKWVNQNPATYSQQQANWAETDSGSVQFIQNKPTALSQFNNDEGFISSSEAPVQSVNGATGAVTITDITGNAATATKATRDGNGSIITTTYAKLASPTFTGTPKAPTATAGTNTTQIATTAFVTSAVSSARGNVTYLSATAPTSPKTGDTWYQIL